MKKNAKRRRQPHASKRKNGTRSTDTQTSKATKTTKLGARNVLAMTRSWGILAVIAFGIVWYTVDQVMATIAEHDLTRIGNGLPAIVQIHDPQCPRCLALQRETRKALKSVDKGKLQYLVANIRNKKGRSFAATHGVPHVTLLLFDSHGKRRNVLSGDYKRETLTTIFAAHVKQFGTLEK